MSLAMMLALSQCLGVLHGVTAVAVYKVPTVVPTIQAAINSMASGDIIELQSLVTESVTLPSSNKVISIFGLGFSAGGPVVWESTATSPLVTASSGWTGTLYIDQTITISNQLTANGVYLFDMTACTSGGDVTIVEAFSIINNAAKCDSYLVGLKRAGAGPWTRSSFVISYSNIMSVVGLVDMGNTACPTDFGIFHSGITASPYSGSGCSNAASGVVPLGANLVGVTSSVTFSVRHCMLQATNTLATSAWQLAPAGTGSIVAAIDDNPSATAGGSVTWSSSGGSLVQLSPAVGGIVNLWWNSNQLSLSANSATIIQVQSLGGTCNVQISSSFFTGAGPAAVPLIYDNTVVATSTTTYLINSNTFSGVSSGTAGSNINIQSMGTWWYVVIDRRRRRRRRSVPNLWSSPILATISAPRLPTTFFLDQLPMQQPTSTVLAPVQCILHQTPCRSVILHVLVRSCMRSPSLPAALPARKPAYRSIQPPLGLVEPRRVQLDKELSSSQASTSTASPQECRSFGTRTRPTGAPPLLAPER